MLNIGIIGCGGRIRSMAKRLSIVGVPYRISAVADPQYEEVLALVRGKGETFLDDSTFYKDADEMLDKESFDGIMIGTRCYLHTEMACKVAAKNIPLFLEKPVGITLEQLRKLEQAFESVTSPVVVSFPLRFTHVAKEAKKIIDSGEIGTIEHFSAFLDCNYGKGYFTSWYRNYEEAGGLFLQKATHDLDLISYMLGQKPKWICAMESQRVYTGDKPMDLTCEECAEKETCSESPYSVKNRFATIEPPVIKEKNFCPFGKDIKNHDSASCIIEYENGVQGTYYQVFFVKQKAASRGIRFHGTKGTLVFDGYESTVIIYDHESPTKRVVEVPFDLIDSHWGGDKELCYDFIMAMKESRPSRAPLSAGISSALMCIKAAESAKERKFCEIKL